MGRQIQVPQQCSLFTPNNNLNKTCNNSTRCKIYYDEYCLAYTEKFIQEKEETNASTIS